LRKQKSHILVRDPKTIQNLSFKPKNRVSEPVQKSSFLISNTPRPEKVLKIVKKDKIEEDDLDIVKVDGSDRQLLKRQKSVWN
jgi:hypothetical protein